MRKMNLNLSIKMNTIPIENRRKYVVFYIKRNETNNVEAIKQLLHHKLI